jgi:hypothetical protein
MAGLQGSRQPAAPAEATSGINPEALQKRVDRAAHFNLFSTPDEKSPGRPIAAADGRGVIGLEICESLHRFDVRVKAGSAERPLTAEQNSVGERAGRFTHRWMVMPHDFAALPGQEPPATVLDPSRSQRFVMLDSVCRFGKGEDGFCGFATGQTFPAGGSGPPEVLVAAIGTVVEGFGRFKGKEAATYVYCGSLSAERGFTGNVLLRVVDTDGRMQASADLPPLERRRPLPEPGITYIVFRGEALPSDPVTPRIGPDGQLQGLNVEQGLRLLHMDFDAAGHDGPQSALRVGEIIGRILARVTFNPAAPGGTVLDPIPFTTVDEFTIVDRNGRPVGSFTGDSSEGRLFNIVVGGQKGIRFGGIGRLLSGTGPFTGIDGLLTDNSVVVFTPHVSASVYVLRINDPDGRFRSAALRDGSGV